MGFLDFLLGLTSPKKNTDKKNKKGFDWENHCESCGELLEDCKCSYNWLSKQDISKGSMFDDKNETKSKNSFDNFNSFEDEED